MSLNHIEAVFSSALPPTERLVALAIADHADRITGEAWPALGTLVRMTGLSERAVRMSVRKLEADGVLTTIRGGGGRSTSRYRMIIDTKPRGAPAAPQMEETEGHDVPGRGAPDAGVRGTTCRGEGHHVPPNRKGTVIEPSMNGHTPASLPLEDPQTPPPTPPPPPKTSPARTGASAPPFRPEIPADLSPKLRESLATWLAKRQKRTRNGDYTEHGWQLFLGKVRKFPEQAVICAIDQALECRWQSIFPERHLPRDQFGAQKKEIAPRREVLDPTAAPEWDWRAAADRLFPGWNRALQWHQLAPDIRQRIEMAAEEKPEKQPELL